MAYIAQYIDNFIRRTKRDKKKMKKTKLDKKEKKEDNDIWKMLLTTLNNLYFPHFQQSQQQLLSQPKPQRTQSQPQLASSVAKKRFPTEEDIEESSTGSKNDDIRSMVKKKRQTRDLNVRTISPSIYESDSPSSSPTTPVSLDNVANSEEKLQKMIELLQENVSLMSKKYSGLKEKHVKLKKEKKEMNKLVNALERHTEMLEEQVQLLKEKKNPRNCTIKFLTSKKDFTNCRTTLPL